MEDILADSDSDLDGIEDERPQANKKKINTWIREDGDNIVDFMDPSAVSKISATKPGENIPLMTQNKEKVRGFKTSSDGRLIIQDDSDDDEATSSKKKGFLSFNSDTDDSGNLFY